MLSREMGGDRNPSYIIITDPQIPPLLSQKSYNTRHGGLAWGAGRGGRWRRGGSCRVLDGEQGFPVKLYSSQKHSS